MFDNLTVEEHLYFFMALKGSKGMVAHDTDRFLADLKMADLRYALARTLSGGQKRALSVALALAGGSSTVILDEPTSLVYFKK